MGIRVLFSYFTQKSQIQIGKLVIFVILRINFLNVVEKLYRPLKASMVPVVYATEDVHKVAPPHSYIDVRDFKSPKHLAEYLFYLDNNEEEYMSYFKWK